MILRVGRTPLAMASGIAAVWLCLCAAGAAAAPRSSTAIGQVRWTPESPGPLIVHDPLRNRLVAIGDTTGRFDVVEVLPLTPGTKWRRVSVDGPRPPAGVTGRVACYDPVQDQVVLQGGRKWFSTATGTYHATEPSTWALSLSGKPAWRRLGDLALENASLAADSVHHRLVLYGGFYDCNDPDSTKHQHKFDVWALASETGAWTRILSGYSLPYVDVAPGDQCRPIATVDAGRDAMILMRAEPRVAPGAPVSPREVWSLSLSDRLWSQLTPSGSEPAGTIDHMDYDPGTDGLVVFAGSSAYGLSLDDPGAWTSFPATGGTGKVARTWDPASRTAFAYDAGGPTDRLDAGTWTWSQLADAVPPHFLPWGRCRYPAVYDSATARIHVFSGSEGWQTYVIRTLTGIQTVTTQIFGGVGYPGNGDLFSFGGSDTLWSPTTVASGPIPDRRSGRGFVLDPVRRRLLLFGGYFEEITTCDRGLSCLTAEPPVAPSRPEFAYIRCPTLYNGLWQVSADPPVSWSQPPVTGVIPSCRYVDAAGYDPVGDRALFFSRDVADHCWALALGADTLAWQPLVIANEPASGVDFTMGTWDARRRCLWVLDSLTMGFATVTCAPDPTWQPATVGGVPPPPGRAYAVALDPELDRLLVIGNGPGPWLWQVPLEQPEWIPVPVTGEAPIVEPLASFTYDPSRSLAVLFGGVTNAPGAYNDVSLASKVNDSTFIVLFDSPTAVMASRVAEDVTPGRVRLVWEIADGAAAALEAERSEDGVAWEPLGAVVPDGQGRAVLVDATVRPGGRYAYRLTALEGGVRRRLDELWVSVPLGLATKLEGALPNPARGEVRLAFSLADGGPATLELLDVIGRRYLRLDAGALGAGRHVLLARPERPFAPGVYFARLSKGPDVQVVRLSVIR